MNVAVVSLTRDRLAWTQHCFQTLHDNAGIPYDHFVLDNGSTDGTAEWLSTLDLSGLFPQTENLGISRGLNTILDALTLDDYDVVVKFDNDCEVVTPNTLRDICELVDTYGLLLSPVIHGLRHPPPTIGGTPLKLGGALVDEKAQIGGIFLAAPAGLYDDLRYSEANPKWGGDDVQVCAQWRAQGGRCGYVRGYEAWHYLSTDGQADTDPVYYARKTREMAGRA